MTQISKQERKAIMQDWKNGLYHSAYLKAHELEERKYEDMTYDSAEYSLDVDDLHGAEYDTADEVIEIDIELIPVAEADEVDTDSALELADWVATYGDLDDVEAELRKVCGDEVADEVLHIRH